MTVATSTGTFALLSLYAANANPQFGDLLSTDSVQFTGLLQGVAVPGCGATVSPCLTRAPTVSVLVLPRKSASLVARAQTRCR